MKCLVVSFGSIGKRHYEILKSFSNVTDVHIVSSQSLDDVKVYRTIAQAFSENNYEYTVIASPTARHFNDLKEVILLSKDSIVLIEKPLFHKFNGDFTLESKNIFVGYNLRFHPVITELIKILNTMSQVYYVNFYVGQYLPAWRPERDYRLSYSSRKEDGGGVLLDLSHEIDLLHYLFGEITSFSSLVTHRSNLEIETEDIALIQGVTTNRVIFSMGLDYLSKIPIRRILIQTNDETIIADLIGSMISRTTMDGKVTDIPISKKDRNFTYSEIHSKVLASKIKDICTFNEGLRINYWIDKIKAQSIIST